DNLLVPERMRLNSQKKFPGCFVVSQHRRVGRTWSQIFHEVAAKSKQADKRSIPAMTQTASKIERATSADWWAEMYSTAGSRKSSAYPTPAPEVNPDQTHQ